MKKVVHNEGNEGRYAIFAISGYGTEIGAKEGKYIETGGSKVRWLFGYAPTLIQACKLALQRHIGNGNRGDYEICLVDPAKKEAGVCLIGPRTLHYLARDLNDITDPKEEMRFYQAIVATVEKLQKRQEGDDGEED